MKKKLIFHSFWLRKKIIVIPLAMKLLTVLMFAGSMAFSASTYSQRAKIDLKIENSSITEILNSIEKSSEFIFIYNANVVNLDLKRSISIKDESIDEVLNFLLQDTNITYRIDDRQVFLYKKDELKIPAEGMEGTKSEQPQKKELSGSINDGKGLPLPGVSVVVKGTTIGTITNANGKFSLIVPADANTLAFSFVGMRSQEIAIGSNKTFNVTLTEDMVGLNEVVAIGYGTQRKATLTGSVVGITNKEITVSPATNLSNSITGLLPGVITQNPSGEPGNDDATILIRGASTTGDTSPLIVVDGIQGGVGWQRINPNDVESISVLKDASAAIYGSRAANGVILITTKRGSLGKPIISYSLNQGVTQPDKLPKWCDSATFADYVNSFLVRQGQQPQYTDAQIQKFKDGSDPLNYPNVDWYKECLRKSTTQSQQNLNIRGGTESIKYSISGSFSNEDGIFKNSVLNFKTYALRSNIDVQLNKYLKVGLDLNSSYQNKNDAYEDWDDLRQVPFYPVYWPNGLPSPGLVYNPAVECTSAWGNNNTSVNINSIKTSFDFTIPGVSGLGVDGYFSYNKNETLLKDWQKPFTVYNYNSTNNSYIAIPGTSLQAPQLSQSSTMSSSSLYNLRVKYETQINDHHISSFIAMEQSDDQSSFFSAFRNNYLSSTLPELFAGSVINQQTNGIDYESGRKNFFGRVNYGFKDKYLLDINLRYDGSSNFPRGKQWGFFPGASGAWRISEENFIKNNLKFITNLKLRASYGQIGNDAIAAFQNLTLYTLNSLGYNYGLPTSPTQGLAAGVSPNPNITWEVAKTSNIGLDANFWNGLLGLEVDVFKQKRSNILATEALAVPVYTGLILPSENIGVVENKGFELLLSTTKKIGDFSYKIAGNIAYAKSKVIYLADPSNVPVWQKAAGHVLGSNLYYHAIGIFRTQAEVDASATVPGTVVGDLKYEDVNKDGTIDEADMVRMDKPSMPEVTFGTNITLAYKNFSLWANFAGAARVWQYYILDCQVGVNSLADVIENRYKPGSMDSKYPNLPTVRTESEVSGLHSTFWLKDASYCRLKTLELSYNVPSKLLSKSHLSAMRLFVNGNNLFTLSALKWFDPENTNTTMIYYPQSRIFNLGINVSF